VTGGAKLPTRAIRFFVRDLGRDVTKERSFPSVPLLPRQKTGAILRNDVLGLTEPAAEKKGEEEGRGKRERKKEKGCLINHRGTMVHEV